MADLSRSLFFISRGKGGEKKQPLATLFSPTFYQRQDLLFFLIG